LAVWWGPTAAGNHRQRQNLLCKANTKLRNANEKPQSKHEKRAKKEKKWGKNNKKLTALNVAKHKSYLNNR